MITLSHRYNIQNGITLALASLDHPRFKFPASVVRALAERSYRHVFVLEMDTLSEHALNAVKALEKSERIKANNLLLEKEANGKITFYLVPVHDSMMALTETGVFPPNSDFEKKFRERLARLSQEKTHGVRAAEDGGRRM